MANILIATKWESLADHPRGKDARFRCLKGFDHQITVVTTFKMGTHWVYLINKDARFGRDHWYPPSIQEKNIASSELAMFLADLQLLELGYSLEDPFKF